MAQDLFDPQRRPIYFHQEGMGTFYPTGVFCRKPNAERQMTLNGLVIKVKKLSESPLLVILCFIFDQTQSHSAFGVLQNTPLPLSIISCSHIVNGIHFF